MCLSLCVYLSMYLFMLYDCLCLWFVYVWYAYLFICWFVIYTIYVCLIMCWFVIYTIYVCLIMCCFASFVHCYVFLKISSRLNSSNEPMFYDVFVYTCIYVSDFLIKITYLLEQKTKILTYLLYCWKDIRLRREVTQIAMITNGKYGTIFNFMALVIIKKKYKYLFKRNTHYNIITQSFITDSVCALVHSVFYVLAATSLNNSLDI
jgi:hypothetical protein